MGLFITSFALLVLVFIISGNKLCCFLFGILILLPTFGKRRSVTIFGPILASLALVVFVFRVDLAVVSSFEFGVRPVKVVYSGWHARRLIVQEKEVLTEDFIFKDHISSLMSPVIYLSIRLPLRTKNEIELESERIVDAYAPNQQRN